MQQSSTSFTHSPFPPSSALRVAPRRMQTRALPRFDPASLDPARSLPRLQQWIDIADRYLRLPATPRDFTLYLAGLMLVFVGAMVHVLLAAQILQAKVERHRLEQELATVEQQNGDLLWKIARQTDMKHLQEQILALGYVPVEEREYVYAAEPAAPLAVQTPAATPAVSAAAPAPRHPLEAWEEFFTLRAPPAQPGSGREQAALSLDAPARSEAAEPWHTWWQQTLDQSSQMLKTLTQR